MTGPETTQEKLEAVGKVLADDPALARQLASLASPSELPDAICRVADQHGIPLTPSEVMDALERMTPRTSGAFDVSDEELEAVAGGGLTSSVFFSLCTGVVGCIITSLVVNAYKGDCARELGFDRPNR